MSLEENDHSGETEPSIHGTDAEPVIHLSESQFTGHSSLGDLLYSENLEPDPEYQESPEEQKYREDMKKDPRYNDFTTDVMEKEGKIGIAISGSYGGFGFSDTLTQALAERGIVTEAHFIRRTNKVLISLISEGKIEPNSQDPQISWINKEYFDGPGFWEIDGYDGAERIVIDKRGYNLWRENETLRKETERLKDILTRASAILESHGTQSRKKIISLKKLLATG